MILQQIVVLYVDTRQAAETSVLMQELFENVYFCQEQKAVSVALATVHTLSSSSVAGPNVPMIRDRITLIGQSLWSKAFPYKGKCCLSARFKGAGPVSSP